MNLKELDSFKLSDAISFHDELNPKLWRGNKLIPVVKEQLETIAQDFLEELGINDLDVRDITISGSNAAYTYTPHSDLDLHILVNMADLPQSDVYKELFNAKKTIYNDSHDITVHGVPVELYVQDSNEPVKSLGEYSIKNDKWLRIPTKRRANFDQSATKLKYEKMLELVNAALKTKNNNKLNKILKKIKQYRQAGLDKYGEFGPENLAFKMLRSQGHITKLYQLRDKLHSERLSIEGMYSVPKEDNLVEKLSKEFEDYDPNGTPPGPEFKPTMPAGTVKVDVSDVYDWYKLGQHISNLKGLGHHDFGQGPPSTILSFGDEDTEHKYIQDLEKTGLTTTDIDPVDPNQPKGMKRQKVDPTYNVNEAKVPNIYQKTIIKSQRAINESIDNIIPSGLYFDIDDVSVNNAYRGKGIGAALYNYVLACIARYNPKVRGLISPRRNRLATATGVSNLYKSLGGQIGIQGKKDVYDFLPIKTNVQLEIEPVSGAAIGYNKKLNISYIVDEAGPYRVVLSAFDHNSMKNIGFISATIVKWDSQSEEMDNENITESASGYIPSNAEKNDPRFKTALTVDIKPDTLKKNAQKLGSKISRAGIPPTLRADGKF